MTNRCRRCNRPLMNEEAVYGWRCAEILGVSEFMATADEETFSRFTHGIINADNLYIDSNLDLTQLQMNELYKSSAKMSLWEGIDDKKVDAARKRSYSIINREDNKNENFAEELNEYMKIRLNMRSEEIKNERLNEFSKCKEKLENTLQEYKKLLSDAKIRHKSVFDKKVF